MEAVLVEPEELAGAFVIDSPLPYCRFDVRAQLAQQGLGEQPDPVLGELAGMDWNSEKLQK